MPVRHPFVSFKPDGTDPSKIKPSHWNADHDVYINLAAGDEIYGILPMQFGGLAANNPYEARANLELGSLATLNQIDLSSDATGTLPLNLGGTGGYDQASAINSLLPYQGYYGGYFLYTDGSNVSWQYAGGGGGSGVNIYVNGSYQGYYNDIYFNDYSYASYGNNLYGADGGGGGYFPPGGSTGDLQFNYYGNFNGDSYLNYDFNNHTLNLNSDGGYGYYPRQIIRSFYYQYADLQQWQDYWGNPMAAISRNGGFKPAQMYDGDADNNSIYYSNNYGKLVFKDPSGTTYELY